MSNSRFHIKKKAAIIFCTLALFIIAYPSMLSAAGIKVVPSAERVTPGEDFYIDVVAENIPGEGLGAIQFRLNLEAPGGNILSVSDTRQGEDDDISVSMPLLIGPSSTGQSGLGDFFWNGKGPHGILVMDNESLKNGSALFTFGHTNGSSPASGSGTVARFHFHVGKYVEAERINITLSDVMLLDTGEVYPLEKNTGATVELRCQVNTPGLIGLSLSEAQNVLSSNKLVAGEVYEINNHGQQYPLGKVLAQSVNPGIPVLCGTGINLAVNTSPSEVESPASTDKINDESGAVLLSWTSSTSSDVAGYKVYLGSQLVKEISNPAASGTEISGLPNEQSSELRITAYDAMGNESPGAVITARPVDDVFPRIRIDSVTDGTYYSADVLPTITVEDATLQSKTITLNDMPYSMAPISMEGNYLLKVNATDSAGNMSSLEIKFAIDKTAPGIAVSGIEKDNYYNASLAPIISITDINLLASSTLLNGSPYLSGAEIALEGRYELKIEASDKAGNNSADTFVFYIDKTKPESHLSMGEPRFESGGEIFVTGSTPFTLTASDAGAVQSGLLEIEFKLNELEWSEYSQPFTLAGFPDGSVSLSYRAVDIAGNTEAPKSLALYMDNTPPVTEIHIGEPKYQSSGALYATKDTVFTLSASDNSSGIGLIEYKVDGGEWSAYEPFKIEAEGKHAVYYRSRDNLSNLEAEQVLEVVVDNTAPETRISASDPLTEGATNIVSPKTAFMLSSQDDLSGVKEIKYRVDEGDWKTYMADFSLLGLPAGVHMISFKAVDNVLNEELEKAITVRLIVLEINKGISSKAAVLAGVWSGNSEKEQKETDLKNLIAILDSLGVDYYIPADTEDFKAGLRSGIYNVYLLIDLKEPLVGEEIREAVHYGDGLIYIKTKPFADPFMDDVFGVKFTGNTTSADLVVNLFKSPISGEDTLQSRGKNVVANLASDTADIYGNVVDKRNTFPSIVFNEYERGKSLLYNFDLLYGTDQARVKGLIENSISLVKPSEYYPKALDSVPIEIKVKNVFGESNLEVKETLPDGTLASGIYPEAAGEDNTIIWRKIFGSGESAGFEYYLELPDMAGDYSTKTEISYENNGDYIFYGEKGLTVTVPRSSSELFSEIIEEIKWLPANGTGDMDKLDAAIQNLLQINANAMTRKDAEENIKSILNAIGEIRKISFDASETRLKLDELLKIWEKKWYLIGE